MKILSITSFLVLQVAACSRYPSAPQYAGSGDCGKATIPTNLQFKDSIQYWTSFTGVPESTRYYEVHSYLEIYNYEKELVQSGRIVSVFPLFVTTNTPAAGEEGYDIYWNGLDMNGKKVDNGVYITKLSWISQIDTTCSCGTILLTTN